MQSLKTSSLPTSTGNLTALAHKEQHEKRVDRRAKWLRGGATAGDKMKVNSKILKVIKNNLIGVDLHQIGSYKKNLW